MCPGASGGRFYVHNAQGDVVFSGNLPPRSGVIPVVWDGIDSEGNQLPPGQYQISAEANFGNSTREARVYGHDRVVSVAIGAGNAITLNLASGRSIDASDAREIFNYPQESDDVFYYFDIRSRRSARAHGGHQ